jgi:hypothetical protein
MCGGGGRVVLLERGGSLKSLRASLLKVSVLSQFAHQVSNAVIL